MSDYLDKPSMVRTVLQAELPSMERRVLCACIGLADPYGILDLETQLVGPMAGVRYRYLGVVLNALTEAGWLLPIEGDEPAVRLTGPLSRFLTVPPP